MDTDEPSQEMIALPNRKIWLEEFHIQTLWTTVIEAGPEPLARYTRRYLLERAQKILRTTEPVLIFDDGEPTLPTFQCFAALRSTPIKPENVESHLNVAWFVEDMDIGIRPLLQEVSNQFEWDAHAIDAKGI